jgi:hypothetical protein
MYYLPHCDLEMLGLVVITEEAMISISTNISTKPL